jgi:hypothetical protein
MPPIRSYVRAPTSTAALALAIGMLAILVPTAAAKPPPCTVSNTDTDQDYGSLQAAVSAAGAGDTLQVNGYCVGVTTVAKDITIEGVGGTPTLDGGRAGTVLHITDGTTTIDGLKITNGVANVEAGGVCCSGGGIAISGSTAAAHVVDSVVTRNSASDFGGGIENDGGILELTDSSVTQNTASSSGGIDNPFATATLTRSTVSGNTAAGGTNCQDAGSCAGGLWNFGGTLTLVDSVVSGNTATRRGGGIVNQTPDGGPTALLTLSGTTSITNNRAYSDPTVNLGGGIWIRDPGSAVTTATPDWTGSIVRNKPDQCSPTVTIDSFICGP